MTRRSALDYRRLAGRALAIIALVGFVSLTPSNVQSASAQTHDQITYLLPHWFKYLSVSDAEFASEVQQLKNRLGDGTYVKVGFTYFIEVNMNVYNINTADSAAIQAQLAVVVDQIDRVIARARANNIPVCISFLTAVRRSYDPLQQQAEAEDRRTMQWYSDNVMAGGWLTHSRYARKLRTVQEAYIRELGKIMANRMAQFPETVVATSGDGEVELSFDRSNIGDPSITEAGSFLADYGSFAVLEFRDWLMNGGTYGPGQPFAGEGYEMATRYQGDASPAIDTNGDGHTLNGDFGTAFTSWDLRFFNWSLADNPNADPNAIPVAVYGAPGFNPAPDAGAGLFDPPRVIAFGTPWWDLWNLFRQRMIWRHNRDFARWMTSSTDPATNTTIPLNRFYSDQVPADYLFGFTPQNPNFRLITSASPHWTADVRPFGSIGITSFNTTDGTNIFQTLKNAAAAVAALGARWGVFEYNASVPSVNNPAFYASDLQTLIQTRPSLIIPVFWDTDVPPFFIKDTPFETMLRDLVTALKDSPLPAPGTPPTPPPPGPGGLPSAPGNFTMVANGLTAVGNWNASTLFIPPADRDPATHYILEAGSASGQANLATLNVGNTTTVTVTGPPGTYFVAVRGVNAAGQGPRSNEVILVLPGGGGGGCNLAPNAPTGLTAQVNGSTVTLAWTASTGCAATSYVLEAGSSAGTSNLANFNTGNANAGYLAPAVPSGTYFVRVRGTNASGTSSASNEVTVIVP